MEVLIAEHGYKASDFGPSERGEKLDGVSFLRGTMLLWERVSYEYNDWDSKPAATVLKNIIASDCTNWRKMADELEQREDEA